MPVPYYPGITITPNLGLSLIGMDEVIALNFVALDTAIGALSPSTIQIANTVLAGPVSGPAALPTFRALVAADIPALAYVTSVFGRTGAVIAVTGDYIVAQITGAAPLASPTLTGTPTAPTNATALDATTQIATDAFVQNALAAYSSQVIARASGVSLAASVSTTTLISVPSTGYYAVDWEVESQTAATSGASATMGFQWTMNGGVTSNNQTLVSLNTTNATSQAGLRKVLFLTAGTNFQYFISFVIGVGGAPTYRYGIVLTKL